MTFRSKKVINYSVYENSDDSDFDINVKEKSKLNLKRKNTFSSESTDFAEEIENSNKLTKSCEKIKKVDKKKVKEKVKSTNEGKKTNKVLLSKSLESNNRTEVIHESTDSTIISTSEIVKIPEIIHPNLFDKINETIKILQNDNDKNNINSEINNENLSLIKSKIVFDKKDNDVITSDIDQRVKLCESFEKDNINIKSSIDSNQSIINILGKQKVAAQLKGTTKNKVNKTSQKYSIVNDSEKHDIEENEKYLKENKEDTKISKAKGKLSNISKKQENSSNILGNSRNLNTEPIILQSVNIDSKKILEDDTFKSYKVSSVSVQNLVSNPIIKNITSPKNISNLVTGNLRIGLSRNQHISKRLHPQK